MEMLVCVVNSLKLAHKDPKSLGTSSKCVLYVLHVCTVRPPSVYCTSSKCVLYVLQVCTVRTACVYCTSSKCVLYVLHVYIRHRHEKASTTRWPPECRVNSGQCAAMQGEVGQIERP